MPGPWSSNQGRRPVAKGDQAGRGFDTSDVWCLRHPGSSHGLRSGVGIVVCLLGVKFSRIGYCSVELARISLTLPSPEVPDPVAYLERLSLTHLGPIHG